MDYEYEPETLTLSTGVKYLPDFWLPQFQAYFEVKPSNEAVVTEECSKARQLAQDQQDANVWLAMGAPNAKNANILPLSQWPNETAIEEILAAPENRYQILEDRRDEGIYWLLSEFVEGSFSRAFAIGGPGTNTNHDRLPLMHWSVEKAYQSATSYKFQETD